MLATATQSGTKKFLVGQPSPTSPRFRTLQGVHEKYGPALATALSAFLRSDFQASLKDLSIQTKGGFQSALPNPTCLMVFRLHPRDERMYLHLNCETVFGLLELLLGGKLGPDPVTPRNLTEIEWSLLEEIVRVMVRPLGEAWKVFAMVEFEVESLVSEPGLLEATQPHQPVVQMNYDLTYGEHSGALQLAVPQSFFDAAGAGQDAKSSSEAHGPDMRQKLVLLAEATVTLEVRLDGPRLPVADLMNLKPGQVIKLDYPLDQPLRASINRTLSLEGAVVSSGKKRGFQVATLP